MKLDELKNYIEIDIESALADRFMDSPKLYIRFLRKLLVTTDFAELEAAAQSGNTDETLRRAHNLKGVCANLGLNGLYKDFSDIVSTIRAGQVDKNIILAKVAAVKLHWDDAIKAIAALEE